MAKEVKLKCGHHVSVSGFVPFRSESGKWMFKGYERECNRQINITIGAKAPTIQTLNKWVSEGIAKALDGCKTEPDGTCQHGFPSWLRALGYI
jgi:hypothetical protein